MKKTLIGAGAFAVLLIVGAASYGVGQSAASGQRSAKTTSEVATERQVGVGVAERTLMACVNALDYAEEIFETASRSLGAAAETVEAIVNSDMARIQAAAEEIGRLNSEVELLGGKYQPNANACRAGL